MPSSPIILERSQMFLKCAVQCAAHTRTMSDKSDSDLFVYLFIWGWTDLLRSTNMSDPLEAKHCTQMQCCSVLPPPNWSNVMVSYSEGNQHLLTWHISRTLIFSIYFEKQNTFHASFKGVSHNSLLILLWLATAVSYCIVLWNQWNKS